MKKWFKRLVWLFLTLLIIILLLVNVGMRMMRYSDSDILTFLKENNTKASIEYLDFNEQRIRVVSEDAEENDSILLVFVHGAPGSWDAFKDYLVDEDLKSKARIVTYDRPGYGGSKNIAMPGIIEQAEALQYLIKHYALKKTVLVGHSYGGPIAGYLTQNYSLNIEAAILIAPLLDPISEPLHWYSYFSYWKMTSWLLPSELRIAGSEKFAHAKELNKIKDNWKLVASKIIHVHGLEDSLAPGKENIDFSNQNIPSEYLETIEYLDKGHLIIWNEYQKMKNIIIEQLNSI